MDCPICLGNPEEPLIVPCCKKVYCGKCITQWNQIKNTCPLCCSVSGDQVINSLKLCPQPQFDDGFLMLQTEIKQLMSRVDHIEVRISNRRDQFKNHKSAVSASLMDYLEKQSERMQAFKNLMEEQYLLQNRGSTVQYMQLLTEAILNVEQSLDNNCIGYDEEDDYDYDYDYEEEQYMEEYMNDYADYEQFEQKVQKKMMGNIKQKKNKSNTSTNSGQTQSLKVVK